MIAFTPTHMVLFLLASIPLAYFFFLGLSGQSNQPRQYTLLAVVRGGIWAVPALAVLALVRFLIGTGYSVGHLYLMYGVGEVLAPLGFAALGVALLERRSFAVDLSAGVTALTSFLTGYLGVLSLFELARYLQYFDSAVLFVLPLVRVGVVIVLPLLCVLALRERYAPRYIAILSGLGFLGFITWVPTLFYLSFHVPAVLLAVVAAVGAGFIQYYLGKQSLGSRA